MAARKQIKNKINSGIKEELIRLMDGNKEEVINIAVDWIYQASPDLRGKRPKEETYKLDQRLFLAYYDALKHQNFTRLHQFIDHVVAFRSAMEFRLSTIEKGCNGLIKACFLMAERVGKSAGFLVDLDEQLDTLYEVLLYELSDKYQAAIEKELKEKIEQLKAAKEDLEKTVAERIKQLQVRIKELEELHKLTVERELKMIVLKKEREELKKTERPST